MPGEDTKTGVALSKADDEIFDYDGGARLKATRLIIVFTDGLSMDKPTLAAKALRRKGVKIYTISVNSIGFVPEMLGIVGDADNVFGPTDEDRIEERLLGEVESSRSCEIQPKKNEKTTSSFGWRITDAAAIVSPVTEASVVSFNTTTESTSESTSTTIASLNSSFESNESENSVENIGHNETSTTDSSLSNVASTILPTSHTWKEPVQLFTVESESTHENMVLNLTNLKTSLAEESNTSEAKDKTEVDQDSTSAQAVATKTTTDTVETSSAVVTIETKTGTRSTQTEVSKDTVASTTVSTTLPPGTTICINPPTSTETPSSSSSTSSHLSTKSFLVKLGVEKEKKEKDPLSKFLGRDVPNSNSVKDDTDLEKNKLDNSSVEKSSENSSKTIEAKTPTSALPTSRFLFSTRVTFRPMSTTRTPTTPETTTTPSTTTSTTTTTTTTTPVTASKKSLKTETTIESTTSTTIQSPSFTPISKSSLSLQTLSEVTAFPTLLSMEKAVTLPINNAVTALGVSKPIKKKIRRIIKRRRNILSSSKAKKVTAKVLEVKRVPTPTTPPIRSTLRPLIIEEKEEEIFSASVQCPMDILFVVDSSGSIARTYDTQKDYLTQLIKKVEPSRSHRVGLIQFAGPHIQKMEWSFDTHSKNSQLLSAIRSVRHLTGTTYIGAALELSLILLDSRRKHTETTVILISDGFSQDDSTQQAKLLRQLPNVKMYAISLNKLTNTKYLTDIVGDRKNLFINDESQWFEEFFTKKLRCVPTTR
ncbi:hypothetical protein B9Z55_025431 [Caenorhabditis nigoni]|nr:hypothetical protein B9Z55_025431 [Caenorhabditis nigoni]